MRMRPWRATFDTGYRKREHAKKAIVRPVQERWLGVDWYPATFICFDVDIRRTDNGRVLCRSKGQTVRVRAEWWRVIVFRLLWEWRYGVPWSG